MMTTTAVIRSIGLWVTAPFIFTFEICEYMEENMCAFFTQFS